MMQRRDDLHRLPDDRTNLRAHDIRHLCTCAGCGGIADKRTAIDSAVVTESGLPLAGDYWHPKCFYEHYDAAHVLRRLPRSEQAKFCLSDLPAGVMRRLLDQEHA